MMEEIKLVPFDDEPVILMLISEKASDIFLNGGMEYACFYIPENSGFNQFIMSNWIKDDFFYDLITSKEFRKRFPELKLLSKYEKTRNLGFKWYHPLLLDGTFAVAFNEGGPYKRMEDPLKAKKIGNDLVQYLIQERYDDVIFYQSSEEWIDELVLVQRSYVIVDKKFKKLWFILITDVD